MLSHDSSADLWDVPDENRKQIHVSTHDEITYTCSRVHYRSLSVWCIPHSQIQSNSWTGRQPKVANVHKFFDWIIILH